MKDFSIEYAHIYTNSKIGDEQQTSLGILRDLQKEKEANGWATSLIILVDDYSFPDPSFDYGSFATWLAGAGHAPDVIMRESQLIPVCDDVLKLVGDRRLAEQVSDYVRTKKYPCSLFVAAWYLLRLGHLSSPLFSHELAARRLINILPVSFKPFEDKAMEIIKATPFADAVDRIENRYFEGRLLA